MKFLQEFGVTLRIPRIHTIDDGRMLLDIRPRVANLACLLGASGSIVGRIENQNDILPVAMLEQENGVSTVVLQRKRRSFRANRQWIGKQPTEHTLLSQLQKT